MKLYKVKIEKSEGGKWIRIFYPNYAGVAAKIYAVFYSNKAPQEHLRLRDADGDEFMSPLPGQALETAGIYNFDSPTPVKLPISYFDEDIDGGNKIVIWGEIFDLE